MKPLTFEDCRKSAEIEDEVMSRLTTIYLALDEVSRIVADHRDLLRRCGSPVADETTACPSVEEAWATVEDIARSIHAFRVVKFPAGDDSNDAFIRYMDELEEAKRQWKP